MTANIWPIQMEDNWLTEQFLRGKQMPSGGKMTKTPMGKGQCMLGRWKTCTGSQ